MKIGDRVRTIENYDYLGVTRRHVGVIVSQTRKYKIPGPPNDLGKTYGQDVEVKYRHKINTVIVQSYELKVVGGKK